MVNHPARALPPAAGLGRAGDRRPADYPFSLRFLRDPGWQLEFNTPVTFLVGENGSGKSTLIEAIAALAGYDEAGGGKGYRPVNHPARALDASGAGLAGHLRAARLPKVTAGWFFRAETFRTVARYLDDLPGAAPDYLSHSHGEGFLRVFAERCTRQGLYLMDEPESALSPARQIELVALLARIQHGASAQVTLATHSPILMATPGARLLELSRGGLTETRLEDTRHFRMLRDFCSDPRGFVAQALDEIARDAEG